MRHPLAHEKPLTDLAQEMLYTTQRLVHQVRELSEGELDLIRQQLQKMTELESAYKPPEGVVGEFIYGRFIASAGMLAWQISPSELEALLDWPIVARARARGLSTEMLEVHLPGRAFEIIMRIVEGTSPKQTVSERVRITALIGGVLEEGLYDLSETERQEIDLLARGRRLSHWGSTGKRHRGK